MKMKLNPTALKPFCLQGESSYPYLSGYSWAFFSDWKMLNTDYGSGPVRFNPENVKRGDILFVDYNCLSDFAERILPKINDPILLITANYGTRADQPMPGPYASLLDDWRIAAWFVQNIDRPPTEKLLPIPIGIANKYWEHGDTSLFDTWVPQSLAKKERKIFCYLNYTLLPNRADCTHHFQNLGIPREKSKPFKEYLEDLSQSIFVASPPGCGLDCHRTWEALLMGCYPIVLSSSLNPLYETLPVVIVRDWSEATMGFLENQQERLQKLKDHAGSRDRLYAPYWFEKVRSMQAGVRALSSL